MHVTTTEMSPDVDRAHTVDKMLDQLTDTAPQQPELVLPTAAEVVDDYELLRVDPNQLVIGPNARKINQDDLDPDFLDDLADQGNFVPIIARWDAHGQLVVRDGQMRTLGLRRVEWPRAFVLAQKVDITDEKAAAIDRLGEQQGG